MKPALLFLIAFAVWTVRAQEEFVAAPATYITKVPFRMLTGGVILLKAKVGTYRDSLNFLLDTGSGGISLDSVTAHKSGLPIEPSDRTIRGIAGIRKVSFCYHQTLHLSGISVDSLDFHINDYELLSNVYGEKIDGIIGYAFLSRYIVEVNYDSLHLAVYSRGSMRYPKGGYLLRPILNFIPVATATVRDENEVKSRFYFDTGAGMCLLMSEEFVDDSLLLRPKINWYASQAEGLGGKAPMRQGVIKQFRFGPYRFRNVPAFIFDDEYNITSYPYLGGLIGNDLLRRFNLILNYEKKEIHLKPNSHFKEEFDYSYTGLSMYLINGKITVVDVMEDSPAEKAGLRPDDVILAVNNNFSQSIQTYKNMLQTPRTRVKMLVQRGNEVSLLTLKVQSLLD